MEGGSRIPVDFIMRVRGCCRMRCVLHYVPLFTALRYVCYIPLRASRGVRFRVLLVLLLFYVLPTYYLVPTKL